MVHKSRKTTPKVRGGKVQRKNRTDHSCIYCHEPPNGPVILRLRPGPGFRHVLLKRDVEAFLQLLPDWQELGRGLNAVLLAPGDEDCMGWHEPGIVAACAWDRVIAGEWGAKFVDDHRDVLERLEVPVELVSEDTYFVSWKEQTEKGFQLMHILLHELGHHHDRITTRSQRRASRGEGYAETYALQYAEQLWARYLAAFGR